MKSRIIYIAVFICISFTYVSVRLLMISSNEEYKEISKLQNISYTPTDKYYANIYDRNLNSFVNQGDSRYNDNQLAVHTIGYLSDNKGVSGLEKEYDEFLRAYTLDNNKIKEGIVTTLDMDIQQIAETITDKYIKSGAVVIMDVKNGDILTSISRPNYSPLNIYEAINDTENSPLINRVNQSYSLGSIFKLIISATAIDSGVDINTEFDCSGSINVLGQNIKCHKTIGHGTVNMIDAMNDSCNTYFINLGSNSSSAKLNWIASSLSFGRIIKYAGNITAKSGYLQTANDLENPIEKANFCFGQGKLMATPIQVCMMTCAFANGGVMPEARLIKGTTLDKSTLENEPEIIYTNSINKETADTVKELMISVVEYEGNKFAKPKYVTAGGKTATAQTGQYNEDNTEKLNCWFTGFFPAENPRYAVTILSENGKSALGESGACFAEICDEIYCKVMT